MFNRNGQALLVVVTMLALFFVVGIAFYSIAQTEKAASIRQLYITRARFVAEAGIAYAKNILNLDRQSNLIDSLDDISFKNFQGDQVDLDGDGQKESRWFNLLDSQGSLFGRFALRVLDEASKININSCQDALLSNLFSQLGLDSSRANTVLAQRPLSAIEQAGSILTKEEFAKVKDFITVYSRDREVDLERNRRMYLNSANPQTILEVFLKRGLNEAAQKAAIFKDAQDSDLVQTILYEFSTSNLYPSSLLDAGGWKKISNYYEAPAGSQTGKFNWSNLAIEDGEYSCFLYGNGISDVVGEVGGQRLLSGEALADKSEVKNGVLNIEITPAKDTTSRFSHIELISQYPKNGLNKKIITGTEGLVINELMVKPLKELTADLPEIEPGQTLAHTFSGITAGTYYVVVLAKNKGGLVGDVSIQEKTATDLHDGDYFPYTVTVSDSGTIAVNIKNNSFSKATFGGIRVSQQPDGEFIELLNLTPQEISLSNFSFEAYSSTGELIAGWPASIPLDTEIQPFQYLVFCIDAQDTSGSPTKLKSNGISFKSIWGQNGIGLDFQDYLNIIDKNFDLLADEGGSLILKNAAGKRVDAIEYQSFQVVDFVTLERPDPTAKIDSDTDGLFDGWYASSGDKGGTPNLTNDNPGMYTQEGGKPVQHTPDEIKLFNRPLLDLTEFVQLSSGEYWKKFNFQDAALICDSFAYEPQKLDLLNSYSGGEFKATDSGFESLGKGDTGLWEFLDIPTGIYWLALEAGDVEAANILVGYKDETMEDFSSFSSLVFSDGIAYFGKIELKGNRETTFNLKLISNSETKIILRDIILEPASYRAGRINLNTASPLVLRSLFGSEDLVEKILETRPLGNKDMRKLGVGELLLLDSQALPRHNWLTVKSDVYELECRGEYLIQENIPVSQEIRTIIERGE